MICRGGEIGRRTSLRNWYRKMWRFKSSLRHTNVDNALIAQLVEQLPLKETVVGSNPTEGTIKKYPLMGIFLWCPQVSELLHSRVGFEQWSLISLSKEIDELVPSPSRVTDEVRGEGKSFLYFLWSQITKSTHMLHILRGLSVRDPDSLLLCYKRKLRLTKLKILKQFSIFFTLCAQGGNRTRTPLLARNFKSLVATNFTTRAICTD